MHGQISFLTSFLAGVLSFFSPCILPILPVYFSVLAGSSKAYENRSRIIANTAAFIMGFSAVFIVLGASVTAISQYLLFNRQIITKIAGILVVIFGLFLTGILNIPFLMRERRTQLQIKEINPVSAFVLGCAFSFGWTPCIGPVLSSVLLMAGSTQSFHQGLWMLIAFSLGLAVPFFILALTAANALNFINKAKKYTVHFQKTAGILLIITGIFLFFNQI